VNAVATSSSSPGGRSRLVRRDVLTRALGSAPRFAVVPGGNMPSLDRGVPQATQLPLLNRMVGMVVLGEDDPTWLQHKIGFKNLRNVHYYLEAARWARLIEEDAIRLTSLGRRYVSSRFEPHVILEGVRGRALFEEVMRVTGGDVPTPDVVASVLRRWSFRYGKGAVTRPRPRLLHALRPRHRRGRQPEGAAARGSLGVGGATGPSGRRRRRRDLAGPAAHAGRGQPAFEEYFAGRGDRRPAAPPAQGGSMTGPITSKIRDFLIGRGPATPERVAEAVPELTEVGGAERALLLMRFDPTLERTGSEMWAARGTAITDDRRVRKAAEKFFDGRRGAPLASVVRAVASETGLPEHQASELLTAQFVVAGTNIFNRRR